MSLEDQLRSLTDPPPSPDPVGKVLARVARQRRRRTWSAVAVTAVAALAVPLALATVTGDQRAVPAATVTVPWALRPAADSSLWGTPFPGKGPAAGLPECQLGELTVGTAVPARVGDGGVTVPVELVNLGPDCALHVDGGSASVRTESGGEVRREPAVSWGVGYEPVRLAHGDHAGAQVSWDNACGADPGRWRVEVTYGNAVLEGQVAEGSAVPSCDKPGLGARYGLGTLTPLNDLGQPRDNPQAVLESTLTAERTVRLGDVLHLVLSVTNPSRGPVSLTPCPTFAFSFSDTGRGSSHRASPALLLNCPEAPDEISPGQVVRFDLELRISTALADGGAKPGTWYVSAGFGSEQDPLPITVEPEAPAAPGATVDCGYARVVGQDTRWAVPSPSVTRAAVPRTGIIATSRGDLAVDFDPASPCAVNAFLDLARQGFWDGTKATGVNKGRFPFITFAKQRYANGYLLPAEITRATRYPAGTVLLYENDGGISSMARLQIAYGDLPYPPEFVPIGRVTSDLAVLQAVGAAGGEFEPKLPITITGVRAVE